MGKVVLVLDEKPNSCMECDILDHEQLCCLGCKVNFGELSKVQSWCPLKPLPERKEETRGIIQRIRDSRYESGYYEEMTGMYKDEHAKGWNDCIDEILGEENGK